MEFIEGKEKFIQAWGTLGSNWGINRTMAQAHALLLISPSALCADEVMQELQISRGNANMNIRALIDWGLVYKEFKAGERKEFFVAEKDMWKIVRQIIIQRKKRELEPIQRFLEEVGPVEGNTQEVEEFRKVINELKLFSTKADRTLENIVNSDSKWFIGTFLNMLK